VDFVEADRAACKMEHNISPVILERFVQFTEYVTLCPGNGTRWEPDRGYRCSYDQDPRDCRQCKADGDASKQTGSQARPAVVSLHEVKPGQKVRVVKIRAKEIVSKRIHEMGIVPGSLIEVEGADSVAESSQVHIKTKGYHLTLSGDEAAGFAVEPIMVSAVCPA
jgi:DtxR family Mn-dependent transcriptional regulator